MIEPKTLRIVIAATLIAILFPLGGLSQLAYASDNGLIGWPFDVSQGPWVIENGYNTNTTAPDHGCNYTSNLNYCYELYSFDYQAIGPAGSTAGKRILSPVSGTAVNFGQAYAGAGNCLSITLSVDSHYHLLVCHIDYPNGIAPTSVTKGVTILGYVDGNLAYGDHIHITLYYLGDNLSDIPTNRQAVSFSDPWMINGCNYPSNGGEDQWGNPSNGVPCVSNNNSAVRVEVALNDPIQGTPITTNPLHPQRTINVLVLDANNQSVVQRSGIVIFNTTTNTFIGTVDLGTALPPGQYLVKLWMQYTLRHQVSGIYSLSPGTATVLPRTPLTAGDINSDNSLSILDYNILIGCYSDLAPAKNCPGGNAAAADITDDGKVNGGDYNLFLRIIGNQKGN